MAKLWRKIWRLNHVFLERNSGNDRIVVRNTDVNGTTRLCRNYETLYCSTYLDYQRYLRFQVRSIGRRQKYIWRICPVYALLQIRPDFGQGNSKRALLRHISVKG